MTFWGRYRLTHSFPSLDTPFELTKKEINDTFSGISFNPSVRAVPQQSTITFCDQIDTSVIDDLGRDLVKMTKIGIILIIAVVLILILANCALEWYKWRCLQNHLEYTRQAWNSDPTVYHQTTTHSAPAVQLTNHNLLTLHGMTAHPLLMKIANRVSALLRLSPSQHIHTQWFFSYIFHPPVLACLLIGTVGLLSIQLQILALGPIARSYQDKAVSSVGDLSTTIATSMNENMLNQSAVYTAQVNAEVDGIQNTINEGVFGWVNSTTTTLNTTLNEFYGEIQDLVETVFGGTILEQPMQDFVFCLIGSKVDALTNALTFMHDNLHVDMPRMNQSALVLSPQDVDEVTRPVALAAIGSGSGEGEDDGGIIGSIVSSYVKTLKKERITFIFFIVMWGVVVLMALLVIFWHSYLKALVDQRKRRRWQKEQREGFDQFAVRGGHITVTDESSVENGARGGMNLPSFTPLASPRPGFLEALTSPRRRIGSTNGVNGLLRPHPLKNLEKNYEKSWDSFIDSSKENEKGTSPVSKSTVQFKTTTRGLIGMGMFGRRTMDKEKFVIDADDEPVSTGNSASTSASQTITSMFSRLAAINPFGRKQRDFEPRPVSPPTYSSPRPGNRSPPNLSIDTGRAANLKLANLPTIETSPTEHGGNGPKSTWSVSPAAPRFPWLPTRGSDGSQGSHKSQAAPLRVRNMDPELGAPSPSDNLQEVRAERKPVVVNGPSIHLAPPLHHGYERPVPPEMPRSVSPAPGISSTRIQAQLPVRKPSPPPFAQYHVPDVNVDTSYNFSPGPGRPLHPGLSTKSVLPANPSTNNVGPLVDPFATPFDDSNAVSPRRQQPQRTPGPSPATNPFLNPAEVWRSSTNGNPFAPVAF